MWGRKMKSIKMIETLFNERKKYGIKPGLNRMYRLLEAFDHPEKKLRVIHVAGTNGKGSTVTLMQNVLRLENYRVGVFSSPSFTGIRGHIVWNDQPIQETHFIALFEALEETINQLDREGNHPTPFEILTVIALRYFVGRTDIVIIEAGMGGREDTTNVVEPILSIITTVAMDHMQFLGNTIDSIASHKAGIIKRGHPVVIGDMNAIASDVIREEAGKQQATLYAFGKDYILEETARELCIRIEKERICIDPLFKGTYQIHNFAVACMGLYLLQKDGIEFHKKTAEEAIRNFQLQGRFELLSKNPAILLDSAHNMAGIEALIHTIKEKYEEKNIHCLFAGFKDKAVHEMIEFLGNNCDEMTVTTFDHERAMSMEELYTLNLRDVHFLSDWRIYLDALYNDKDSETLYIITGSMHFIMQVRQYLLS